MGSCMNWQNRDDFKDLRRWMIEITKKKRIEAREKSESCLPLLKYCIANNIFKWEQAVLLKVILI